MRSFGRDLLFGCAACILATWASTVASAAYTETVLHEFLYATGAGPAGGPTVDPSTGALYGVAARGGSGNGIIYQILPPKAGNSSWTYNVIYYFPTGPKYNTHVIVAAGVVYFSAVTGGSGCGSGGCGTVFSLTPPESGTGNWASTALFQFTGGENGWSPTNGLAMDNNGALYGTAGLGGIGCRRTNPPGCGLVFKLTPPLKSGQSWSYSVLYRFPGGTTGYLPTGLIFDRQGNLYGWAEVDTASGKSLVFKLTPPSGGGEWAETVIYRYYAGSTNCAPGYLAIDANGALYDALSGTCNYAFQLAPSAADPSVWVKTEMRKFSGAGVQAPLTVDSAGHVYGVTRQTDTVFLLRPRSGVPGKWNYELLSDFSSGGSYPNGSLVVGSGGAIYGATQSGGHDNNGIIFSLSP